MNFFLKVEDCTAAIGIAKASSLWLYTAVGGTTINSGTPCTCSIHSSGGGSSAHPQGRPAICHHWLHHSMYLCLLQEIVTGVTGLQMYPVCDMKYNGTQGAKKICQNYFIHSQSLKFGGQLNLILSCLKSKYSSKMDKRSYRCQSRFSSCYKSLPYIYEF